VLPNGTSICAIIVEKVKYKLMVIVDDEVASQKSLPLSSLIYSQNDNSLTFGGSISESSYNTV
jgi:hypothetical protein